MGIKGIRQEMDFDSDVDAFLRFLVDIRPTKHFVVWLREWSLHGKT